MACDYVTKNKKQAASAIVVIDYFINMAPNQLFISLITKYSINITASDIFFLIS